jgi:hypothetical protein
MNTKSSKKQNKKPDKKQTGWLKGAMQLTVRPLPKPSVKSIRQSPDAVLSLSANLNMRKGWSCTTQTTKSATDYLLKNTQSTKSNLVAGSLFQRPS